MGEVYRAHDTSLSRDIAIKILPRTFAAQCRSAGPIPREARVLASLNHPNIAAIHGFEEIRRCRRLWCWSWWRADAGRRIASGPIPIDKALDYARQIAEALEAAHEKGIVHRDFKPANIKITPARRGEGAGFRAGKGIWGREPRRPVAPS